MHQIITIPVMLCRPGFTLFVSTGLSKGLTDNGCNDCLCPNPVSSACLSVQVVEALRPHGLTLQNFASIREQAIGGFIQVGAHGTGASIPPVDQQVVAMKLVTPARGTLELSEVSASQPSTHVQAQDVKSLI